MFTRFRFLSILMVAALLVGCSPSETPDAGGGGEGATAELASDSYNCDGTFPDDLPEQSQVGADSFSWNSFLAVSTQGTTPEWTAWFSTVDLIECNQPGGPVDGTCEESGVYVPTACKDKYASNPLPIIDQVGKVDDGFQEAKTQGLSKDPVIASNGEFLRYQILVSPGTYEFITNQGYQQNSVLEASGGVNFPCDPDPDVYSWGMSLKLAWMPMTGTLPTDKSNYYHQDMLVYTPGYRNSTGEDSCEQVTMGLVGMHLVRKTTSQPAWVWATFEHNLNAPLCTTEPNSGYTGSGTPNGQGTPNENCPASVASSYNFYPASCTSPVADGSSCAPCNKGWDKKQPQGGPTYGLAQNGADGECVNPAITKNAASWCLDKPPATAYGTSLLCRQVEPAGYGYTGSTFADTEPNVACRPSSGVWSNYDLISTQWAQTGGDSPIPNNCNEDVQGIMVGYDDSENTRLRYPERIVPATASIVGEADPLNPGTTPTSSARSFMANTSMESYERSNCMGCHAKSTINESGQLGTDGSNGTDFVYFLGLEVPGFNASN